MPTTVEIPLELDVVDPTTANAFWTLNQGPFWDQGVYRFIKVNSPPSGDSVMNWKTAIPKNLAPTAAWNLILHHQCSDGGQGRVLLRVDAEVVGSGDTPVAMTTIVPNQTFGVGTSGDRNITPLSSTNFDSLVTLVAGEALHVRLKRVSLSSSGDSLTGNWDLLLPPVVRLDIA